MGVAEKTAVLETQEATDEQITQCLRVLHGKSDEHKFVGLLMITKLSATLPKQVDVLHQIVQTVGTGFFMRLLQTKGTDDDDQLSQYQTLGLTLMSSFCSDNELAEQFAQDKLIHWLLQHLSTIPSLSTSLQDCLQILQGLVQTEKGKCLFLQPNQLRRLWNTVKQVTSTVTTDTNTVDHMLVSLWSIMEILSMNSEFWNISTRADFDFLCHTFATIQSHSSLAMIGIILQCIHNIEVGHVSIEYFNSQTLGELRIGLFQFFRGQWTFQERDRGLCVVDGLIQQQYIGPAWMMGPTQATDDRKDGTFLVFVLKLVAIEIKLMLDDAELALIQMEEVEVVHVEEEERQQQEILRSLTMLPVCFAVVEKIIMTLVSGNDESVQSLPFDMVLDLKKTFTELFAVVLEMLTIARDFTATHRYVALKDAQSPSIYQLDAIICACIRVFGAWLAEDSDTHVDQVLSVIPFVVLYQPLHSLQEGEQLDSDDEEADNNSLCEEDHVDLLHFLLPALLQFSATREGGQVLSETSDLLRRLLRFTCQICTHTMDVNSISTLTLCLGILMNMLLHQNEHLLHSLEWYRALAFLLPLACTTGHHVLELTLCEDARGHDERYQLLLHVVGVVLLIGSYFQQPRQLPCLLSPAISNQVDPFNEIVEWIITHPPLVSSSETVDVWTLCCTITKRSPLTEQVFGQH